MRSLESANPALKSAPPEPAPMPAEDEDKGMNCKEMTDRIESEVSAGELTRARATAERVKKRCHDRRSVEKADYLSQIAERIAIDFSVDEEKENAKLKDLVGEYTPEDRRKWEESGWLEWRYIDGKKMYFNGAASNLVRLRRFRQDRPAHDDMIANDPIRAFRTKISPDLIRLSGSGAEPVSPVEMKVDYTITVKPDAVPAGKTVRCWLPWPRTDQPRQRDVTFLSASEPKYRISSDSAVHRSIYMEAKAEKGKPVVFNASFKYRSYGQYFALKDRELKPYNKGSALYRKYTAEQRPHIAFTGEVTKLADEIAGAEKDPYQLVRKMYLWFDKNIPWASALEYSIMKNIPGYVIANKKGDCGMQSMLLMTMLRYKGIPARWQSGWMLDPKGENLHDWIEVYYEGVGWVPVDPEHGLQRSDDQSVREFYISGIDPYRLILNDGISGKFEPAKKYLRSEPNDFQRGEVEWDGGNLYFDKWDYELKVEYL